MNYRDFRSLESIDVCTLQRLRVIEQLRRPGVYIQPWSWTAAYDSTIDDYLRSSHRRAYLWKCAQYVKRMGHRPRGALIWLWFAIRDLDEIRRHDDEHIVHLRVPVAELLVSVHARWQHVLWNSHISDPEARHLPVVREQTRASKRASWARIFDVPPEAAMSELQAVVDRVEPAWVTRIEALPPIGDHC